MPVCLLSTRPRRARTEGAPTVKEEIRALEERSPCLDRAEEKGRGTHQQAVAKKGGTGCGEGGFIEEQEGGETGDPNGPCTGRKTV